MDRVIKCRPRFALAVFALVVALTGCGAIQPRSTAAESADHFYESPPWNTLEMMKMNTEIV